MKPILLSLFTIPLLAAHSASAPKGAPSLRAARLRTEYAANPIGIDVMKPRFSWILEDTRRGSRQSAFQILVASDATKLKSGQADLWDSGKQLSSNSVLVEYAGKALESRTRYHVAVNVWDADGAAGKGATGTFETGLGEGGWKGNWIGRPIPANTGKVDTTGVQWIWHDKSATTSSGPDGVRHFSKRFTLPNKAVAKASLYAAVDNLYQAALNGKHLVSGGGWQAFQITDITKVVKPGANLLSMIANNLDGPAGLAAMILVNFEDGTSARVVSDGTWKTNNSSKKQWTDADLDDSDWQAAHVVASLGVAPWGMPGLPAKGGPATLLRRELLIRYPIQRARLYITALGSYRAHINGQRVGNDILTPDWTDYRVRTTYQTYDVTSMLKRGENVIGVHLGDGWYSSGIGWQLQRDAFGPPPPRLLAQLHITHQDGSETALYTGQSWSAAESPIRRSEIYAGETYDARMEQPGWDSPGFGTGKGWAPAKEFADLSPKITAQLSPLVRETEQIKPIAMTSPANDTYVFDMGQNMVGWVRINIPGAYGKSVRLRFAETLQANGQIYTENLRAAEATDTYTCKGNRIETWEPIFTFHGFRYVEVTGLGQKPDKNLITGIVFHTDTERVGTFESSSAMVNKVWLNTMWGQRGNMVTVPTDCPQRDERLGWMGDANIFWPTACYNMDMSAFSWKWLQDVIEAQSKEGGYSDVAPRIVADRDGAPGWADAGVAVPYYAYRQYGDKKLLAHCWPHMEAYLALLLKHNPNYLWLNRRNNDYGDWVPANSETPKDVIGTFFWALNCKMMAEMADILGKPADAAKYRDLYSKIKAAFQQRFVKPDGTIGNGSQTCYVMALKGEMVDGPMKELAVKKLVEDINKRNGHLSTGFIGTAYLMPILSEHGQNDIAYKLMLNELFPSWGYMVFKGATTMWERWNGDTGDPAMNSFNHYAYGAVAEWMYRCVLGIETDTNAAFGKIVIRPRIGPGLTHAKGSYESIRGTISSAWRKVNGGLELDITIPANTTARVVIPMGAKGVVTENGKPIAGAEGIKLRGTEGDAAVVEVGSGSYRFRVAVR